MPQIEKAYILQAIIFFILIMLILLAYATIILAIKNESEQQKKRWLINTNLLIRRAIFFEGEGNLLIREKILKLFKKSAFRSFFTSQLVLSAKNLSGISNDNLKKLYNQLNLQKDSEKRLKSNFWHVKAQGIQELGLMDQKQYADDLLKLTNNKNDFVRMEAQTAIVKFEGFEGLKFLNSVTYPITEWQQINLLHELSQLPPETFQGVEGWLRSKNDFVVLFSLKLVGTYHLFELHENVIQCLWHPTKAIALETIKCLQEIYTDATSDQLMSFYNQTSDKDKKIAILKALKVIASEDNLVFLLKQLDDNDNQIKLEAARAVSASGPNGLNELLTYPKSYQYPWNKIIHQIKQEVR